MLVPYFALCLLRLERKAAFGDDSLARLQSIRDAAHSIDHATGFNLAHFKPGDLILSLCLRLALLSFLCLIVVSRFRHKYNGSPIQALDRFIGYHLRYFAALYAGPQADFGKGSDSQASAWIQVSRHVYGRCAPLRSKAGQCKRLGL